VIQALNAFIGGVTFIVLPLLMLDKRVPIEEMGLIFAVMPIFMQTFRLLFGILSDYVGRKIFYWLDGLMCTASLVFYYFSASPVGFLLGKMGEGVRDASLWSVNRAYFMDHSKEKEAALIKLRGVDSALGAIGMLAAGFLVVLLFYYNTLLLLIGLSLLILPNVKLMHDAVKFREKLDVRRIVQALDFRRKSAKFKNFIVIFTLLGLSWGFITGYILPVFLQSLGVPVQDIGLLLGVRALCNAGVLYLFTKIWTGKRKIIVGGLLFAFMLGLLALSVSAGVAAVSVLVVLTGLVAGVADAGFETIFVSVSDHNFVGRDIGIIMIGLQAGQSLTQGLSGYVITYLGYPAMFFMAAMLYALFSVASYHNMNGKD
jgi:MFS family permease